ncbi:MAG: hypothetical protein ACOX6D_04725 [Thermoguttaceae bacterium]|jgi:hypothetical protein
MTEEKRESLSEEDIFRLELLADGELDTEARRELLARLDQTTDGWRRCAFTFLESQCLSESLKDFGVREPAVKRAVETGVGSECSARPLPDANTSTDSEILCASPPASPISETPATLRPSRRRSFWRPVLVSAAGLLVGFFLWQEIRQDSAPDPPRVQPKKRTYAGAEPSDNDKFESDALGFEVADAGLFGAADTEVSSSVELATAKQAPAEKAALAVLSNGRPAATGLSAASSSPPTVGAPSAIAGRPSEENETIRHITIRRPGGLDEISIPCVEADSYVSDNSAEALAEPLRRTGYQVETLHEELKFRLNGGKTLIVPVDTIEVHHLPRQNLHLL